MIVDQEADNVGSGVVADSIMPVGHVGDSVETYLGIEDAFFTFQGAR